jgi:hypothetical protein
MEGVCTGLDRHNRVFALSDFSFPIPSFSFSSLKFQTEETPRNTWSFFAAQMYGVYWGAI